MRWLLYLRNGEKKRMFYSFLNFFNAEVLLVILSAWGLGVTLYLLKMYLQRQNTYHTRVQDRITRIGNQPLGQGERQNP